MERPCAFLPRGGPRHAADPGEQSPGTEGRETGGGGFAVTFQEAVYAAPLRSDDLLALDEALTQLADLDPRQAQMVEYRFFAGLTLEETAHALGLSSMTVKRDWRAARAWLAHTLRAA